MDMGQGSDVPSIEWRRTEHWLAESRWVRSLARAIARDPGRSEDLAQEAWVVALRRDSGGDVPRGWMGGVLRNLARTQRRGEQRRKSREERAARGEAQPSAEEAVRRAELQQAVVRAVLDLEEPYRSTVLLRYLEELSVAEVAKRTHSNPSTVRVRSHRGLALLRGSLEEGWGDESTLLRNLAVLGTTGLGEAALSSAAPTAMAPSILWKGIVMKFAGKLGVLAAIGLLPLGIWWSRSDPSGGVVADPSGIEIAEDETVDQAWVEPRASEDPRRTSIPEPGSAAVRTADSEALGVEEPAAAFGETRLQGRVVDADGTGIEGAWVLRLGPDPNPSPNERAEPIVVEELRSGPGGGFQFDDLRPFVEYSIRATAPGFADSPVHLLETQVGATLVLDRAVRLHGHVRDRVTGLGIPDAKVEVFVPAVRSPGFGESTGCWTDGAGAYEAAGMPGGTHLKLVVHIDGQVPTERSVRTLARDDTEFDVWVGEHRPLEVRTVDAQTGLRVSGVEIRSSLESASPMATTDGDGVARIRIGRGGPSKNEASPQRFRPNRHGHGTLFLEAAGYCMTQVSMTNLDVRDQDWVEWPMQPSARIEGRVVDGDGAGIEGVTLRTTLFEDYSLFDSKACSFGPSRDSRRVTTDGEGHFALDDVPWGLPFSEVSVRTREGVEREVKDLSPAEAGRTRTVEIVLSEEATLRGIVRANGKLHSGYVYIKTQDDQVYRYTQADESGRYEIPHLDPGQYWIAACSNDATATWTPDLPFEVGPGSIDPIDFDIELDLLYLRGELVDENGAPVGGQDVIAFAQNESGGYGQILAGMGKSRPDGTFEVGVKETEVAGQLYVIGVFRSQNGVTEYDVEPEGDPVRLVIATLVPVRITATAGVGAAPVTRLSVTWEDTDSGQKGTVSGGFAVPTDARGNLEVYLPRGNLKLTLRSPGASSSPVELEDVHVFDDDQPGSLSVQFLE